MTPQVQLITPEMAKVYLSKNIDNRQQRGWYVSCLAKAIKRGDWILTHQGIGISKLPCLLPSLSTIANLKLQAFSMDITFGRVMRSMLFILISRMG